MLVGRHATSAQPFAAVRLLPVIIALGTVGAGWAIAAAGQEPKQPPVKALETELRQMAKGGWLAELEEGIKVCDLYIAEANSSRVTLRKAESPESKVLADRLMVAAAVVAVIKGELEKEGRLAVGQLVDLWKAVERRDAAAFRKARPTVAKQLEAVRHELEKHLAELRTLSTLKPAFSELSRAVVRSSRAMVNPPRVPSRLTLITRRTNILR